MDHQKTLLWQTYFPFPEVWETQQQMLTLAAQNPHGVYEVPTGSGKTAVGYTILKALQAHGPDGALLYVTPTKTLVNQAVSQFPDLKPLYGRNEHPCLYYQDHGVAAQADEIPCAMLVRQAKCGHYVPSVAALRTLPVEPCPYYAQKVQALQGGEIVVCTTAYFLLTKLFQNTPEHITGLVLDEVHRIAQVARQLFSYDITDWHLNRLITFLEQFDQPQAKLLAEFRDLFVRIAQRKSGSVPMLLSEFEIALLTDALAELSLTQTAGRIGAALASGKLDPIACQEELKFFEVLERDIKRYLVSFRYAMAEAGKRHPLNYVVAYFEKNLPGRNRVRYRLCIRSHYVAPLIRRCLDADHIVAYSATIGDPEVFGFETGIRLPASAYVSTFPTQNARLYLPSDTPNLAVKSCGIGDKEQALTAVAQAVAQLKTHQLRALVVVASEAERQRFLELAIGLNLSAVSYGNGTSAKAAAQRFQAGEGQVLVGTSAQYAHGLDLPRQVAPVIFFLRPGYPSPDDPAAQFEEKRFGQKRWSVWNWRAIIEALQVRGRNIRSAEDLGVTFFISQQFARFLPGALPQWLKPSWQEGKPFQEQLAEAIEFLKG